MLPWFTKYPNQNDEILNLDFVITQVENLKAAYEAFLAANSLTFADPITWDITKQYSKNTIVLSPEGDAYLSKNVVGAGIQLNNIDYWLEIFNFADYVRTANSNLTVHIEQNTTRATASYAVDDWLLWEDVLYKVTAAIDADDLLTVGTNIVHFTVEDFCRAWQTYMVNTILQYKNDIDASELQFNNTMTGLVNQYKNDIDASEAAYRTQLAGDIIATTNSLQAQLDAAIAGATVDSEVINARIGANGVTYASLGEAIRTQIEYLNNPMEMVKKQLNHVNIFDIFTDATEGIFINVDGGSGALPTWTAVKFPVIGGKNISFQKKGIRCMTCFWDESDNVVTGGTDNATSSVVTIPDDAVLMSVSCATASLDQICIIYSDTLINDYISFDYTYPSNYIDVMRGSEAENANSINLANNENNYEAVIQAATMIDPIVIRKDLLMDFGIYSNYDIVDSTISLCSDFIANVAAKKIYYDNTNYQMDVVLYDATKTCIGHTGWANLPNGWDTAGYSITAPYLKLCIKKRDGSNSALNETSVYLLYSIDNNFEYKQAYTIDTSIGLLQGLKYCEANNIKKVVVEAGNYDVIAEYEDYYGGDYFDDYVDYSGTDKFDRGLWLDNIELTFNTGAFVEANYQGNNGNVKQNFSAFATGNNVTIDGLNLEATNLRYGIHADFNTGSELTTITIKNCDLSHWKSSNNNNQAIGAGLGLHTRWEVTNTIFRSMGNYPVFRIHNRGLTAAMGQMIVKDCYIDGEGYFLFNSLGDSDPTPILVSNCSWINEPYVGKELPDAEDNMLLIAWNNEQRNL